MIDRFSLNQATTKHWPLPALAAGCVAAGVTQVGLWREDIQGYGVEKSRRLMDDHGLTVTSLCRSGFFHTDGWLDENKKAIDEAHAVGAPVLLLVSGGLPPGSRDIDGARATVGARIGELVEHALGAGVRLAVEPLHPMFASDRCVVSTLAQALDLAAPYPPAAVGVAIDTYHLWWDDTIWSAIARAGREDRIACFQVADWVTPLPAGVLLGRGLPGAGVVETRRFREAVDATGYTGPIEVEVFDEALWQRPGDDILADTLTAFRTHVL